MTTRQKAIYDGIAATETEFRDGECFICKQNTSSVAGNPHEWPFWLPYYGGNGKTRCYCWGCVIKAVHESEEAELEKLREALSWILSRFKAVLASKPVRDADEVIAGAEAALEEKGSE